MDSYIKRNPEKRYDFPVSCATSIKTGSQLFANGELMPRWLWILGVVALVAMIAGFVTFGGGNMGQ